MELASHFATPNAAYTNPNYPAPLTDADKATIAKVKSGGGDHPGHGDHQLTLPATLPTYISTTHIITSGIAGTMIAGGQMGDAGADWASEFGPAHDAYFG